MCEMRMGGIDTDVLTPICGNLNLFSRRMPFHMCACKSRTQCIMGLKQRCQVLFVVDLNLCTTPARITQSYDMNLKKA